MNLRQVHRYQASERGKATRALYVASPARAQSLHKYNTGPKGRATWARFYAAHFQPVSMEPVPMAYVGDEVFEQARVAAGIHVEYGSDWGQNDILGEAVLAILEGRDPKLAIRSWRRRERAIERSTRYIGDAQIGADGHGGYLVEWVDRDVA